MYLTALIKSKPGNATKLSSLALDLVTASRHDEGCEQYHLHQSLQDENLFIFQERWASEELLQAHNQQPHLQHFAASVKDLIEGEIIIHQHELIA